MLAAFAETVPEMPVHACFCFLNPSGQAGGAALPIFRTLSINGFPLFIPRKLSKRLNAPGALTARSRRQIAEMLVRAFPAA